MVYSVDDEFGNQITTGLNSYEQALYSSKCYLSAHKDAPCVEIYTKDESWVVSRQEVLH